MVKQIAPTLPGLPKLDVLEKKYIVEFKDDSGKVLEFRPFSHYDNDASTRDTANEVEAYILDGEGKSLRKVLSGYSVRYSDGSHNNYSGETVNEALSKLSLEDRSRVRYVLVVTKSTVETVVTLVRNSPDRVRSTRMDKDEISAII